MIVETIVGIILLAVAVILILAMTKPDEMRIERSTVINADAATVFGHINNLKKEHEWDPWVEMDPNAKYEFNGPEEGEGASLSWEGKKTGKGTMTITKSVPNSLVESRLDFYKPMTNTSMAEFRLEADNDNTKVTWLMYGPVNFKGKVASVFMNCEKMVGGQFEQGLNNLKKVVEK